MIETWVEKNEWKRKNIKKSLVFNKLKNIDGLFLCERGLFIRLFGKKVDKLNGFLIGSSHGFDILKVKGILHLSPIYVNTSGRVCSQTINHVGMGRCKSIGKSVVVCGMVAVSVVPHDVIPVARSGCGVYCRCDLDTLVFYLLKIHLLSSVLAPIRRITLPNSVRFVPNVNVTCVLQL